MGIGFLAEEGEIKGERREETKYDVYLEKPVKVNISGGTQGIGVLNSCERLDHGYLFLLKPSIIYDANGKPYIEDEAPSIVSSNGNPIALHPAKEGLEAYLRGMIEKEEKKQ